jgi:8-oxo-dGTP pyrophosphatase MutT (NUDIX family)
MQNKKGKAVSERDLYYVAVKLFLERKGKLFIFKDRFGDWDLPGGRIQKHEFHAPLDQVIKRKMAEELGSSARYKLGKPVVFMRHQRLERSTKKTVRIFAIGYRATLLSGNLGLSEMHTESLWVSIKSFNPKRYFEGGWLEGVQEYLRLVRR